MRMMKLTSILTILIISAMLAHNAVAAIALPDSTYGDDNGWTGERIYTEDGFNMGVRWTVYDFVSDPDEISWVGDLDFPDGDQYLYAYLVFNFGGENIESFSLLDLEGNAVNQSSMHDTQAIDDEDDNDDKMPRNPSETQGVWEWSFDSGSYLLAGEHSAFLIFSSPYAPVKGDFKVEAPPSGDFPTGGSEETTIPEPGTLALIGIGSGWLLARKNRKRQVT